MIVVLCSRIFYVWRWSILLYIKMFKVFCTVKILHILYMAYSTSFFLSFWHIYGFMETTYVSRPTFVTRSCIYLYKISIDRIITMYVFCWEVYLPQYDSWWTETSCWNKQQTKVLLTYYGLIVHEYFDGQFYDSSMPVI
jgi:hypothetical protein